MEWLRYQLPSEEEHYRWIGNQWTEKKERFFGTEPLLGGAAWTQIVCVRKLILRIKIDCEDIAAKIKLEGVRGRWRWNVRAIETWFGDFKWSVLHNKTKDAHMNNAQPRSCCCTCFVISLNILPCLADRSGIAQFQLQLLFQMHCQLSLSPKDEWRSIY